MLIVGIDCAVDQRKMGLSIGKYHMNKIELVDVIPTTKKQKLSEMIYEVIKDESHVLIAIDAPLGWPVSLGNDLSLHRAGQKIESNANDLFRRETDRFIKREIGKQPLDVGADRIARTAHKALQIIEELRELTNEKIELAWTKTLNHGISVIEVYPAATLACYGIKNTGYKEKDITVRTEMVNQLNNYIQFPKVFELLEKNADALDSTVCLLAAKDFLEGNVHYPLDIQLAKKEGWIWVKKIIV